MRALVTGGTKGIGRAVALQLAVSGSTVLMNYLADDVAAEEAGAAVRAAGGDARLIRADACSAQGAELLAEYARREVGVLDLVVHCAVAAASGGALDTDADVFRESIERNGLSFLWLVRACADLLEPGASAIFMSSGGATRAVPNYAPLGTAKALAEALVRYLAVELAPRGVRVNCVSSAAVDTAALRAMMPGSADKFLDDSARRNPSGRRLETTDVARVVMLLASPEAGMIQGQTIRVDGGLGLV